MVLNATHTFAELEVSPGSYDEVHRLLTKAGYDHAFMPAGGIDMHGIGLTRRPEDPAISPPFRFKANDIIHEKENPGEPSKVLKCVAVEGEQGPRLFYLAERLDDEFVLVIEENQAVLK